MATIAPEQLKTLTTPQNTPQANNSEVVIGTGACDIVKNYSWDVKIAYAVCMAESGGNPNAANLNDRHNGCIGSYGLMQIACIHGGIFYDPKQNMDKAFEIYNRSGWKPWGAWSSGAYLRHM